MTGGHIRGFNNRGVHPVVSADREISEDDVQDVIKNAKAINLPAENTVIHAVRQHFLVDGHDGITDPVGMLGARIAVDMHVVHGNTNRLQNAVRIVKGLQLEVEEVVFNGLASSLALLTNEQKELGALVIDIGGGTTDYAVYADGVIKYTGALALGGDHVSNDLGHGLKVLVEPRGKIKKGIRLGARGRNDERPHAHDHKRTRTAAQDNQRRASATHHVAAARGNFPDHRGGFGAGRNDGLSARRCFSLRRLRARAANRRTRAVGFTDARFARPDQFHQRAGIRAQPAGICHRHRPREIRLAQNAQTRGQIIVYCGNQRRVRKIFTTFVNSNRHEN